ncbi:universal stress protein [Actinoplanes sp. KI2]|uniref:universal stress protein n=1 Tax=Actinoplanes sp. KI2 TaxID=2983315 RepID=UPI0021D5C9B3|nr:universal stress protein [Actinoplanes sp. KI2]MCU7724271.1 universal stress protein [Actinoplanes sp. KI2]
MISSRVVLCGVDGSTTSLRAAMYAAGIARRERCRLVVAYVIAPGPFEWAVMGGGGLLAQLRAELSRTVEAEVRALVEDCPGTVTFVSRVGRPTDCLSAIADEVRADMVVVGVSRGWRRRCGVSVAAGLIRVGRWPVVVVP